MVTQFTTNYNFSQGTYYGGQFYAVGKAALQEIVDYISETEGKSLGNVTSDQYLFKPGSLNIYSTGLGDKLFAPFANRGYVDLLGKGLTAIQNGTLAPKTNIGTIKFIGYASVLHFPDDFFSNKNKYLSKTNNPIVKTSTRSIQHAILGACANTSIYMYVLSKGYVFNQDPQEALGGMSTVTSNAHTVANNAVEIHVYPPNTPNPNPNQFRLPGASVQKGVYTQCPWNAITAFNGNQVVSLTADGQDCMQVPGPNTALLLQMHRKSTFNGQNANSHPVFGTKYSPVTTLSAEQQNNLYNKNAFEHLFGIAAEGNPFGAYKNYGSTVEAALQNPYFHDYIKQVNMYSPLQSAEVKPSWCTSWQALPVHPANTNFESVSYFNAPFYRAELDVNFEDFFEIYLKNTGLIEYNPTVATIKIKEILLAVHGTQQEGEEISEGEDTDISVIIDALSETLSDGEGEISGDLVDLMEDVLEAPLSAEELEELQKLQDFVDFGIFVGQKAADDIAEGFETGVEQLYISPVQQEIIDNVLEKQKTPQEAFAIGPEYKGGTHFINDQVIRATKINNSLSKTILNEFTKYDKDGEARIQRVTSYEKDKFTSFTLPYGTVVEVVEEFINRPSGLFHMIRTIHGSYPKFGSKQSFFIASKLLSKLPQTRPSLNTMFKNYATNKEKIEWINMKDEEIFFDRRLLAYSVVVEPVSPITGQKVSSMLDCQKTVNELETLAMQHGIEALMRCYNKRFFIADSVTTTLLHLMNEVFQFAYTGDSIIESKKGLSWYLDPRPKSKLRFIVRIPAKYFDALPQKSEYFEDIPHFKKQLFVSQTQQPIDAAPMPSSGVSDFRITTLLTCNIEHKIAMATSIMEKYKEQIDTWNGQVDGLDLGLEIERLRSFPSAMKKFVTENGFRYRPDGEDELEIGCNSKFRLKYVSYVRAGLSKPLRICFNRFKRKTPMKFSRTMGYIYYLDDIIELERKLLSGASDKNAMNWVEFIQKYTYPMPAIKPSSRKATSPLSSENITNKQDKAKKIEEKYNKILELNPAALSAQIKELSSPNLKLELASARLQHKDFSGDIFIEKIPELVGAIRNLSPDFDGLQNLFSMVFDKIDISTLSSISAGSLAVDMPSIDIENAFSLAALDSPEISGLQFDKIFNFLPDTTVDKINLVESYFDGTISLGDIEGELPSDTLDMVLDFFDKKEQTQVPKGREAEIMKKGSLEDIKCLGLDTKYGTTSPRLDNRQNTKKELIKMIVPPSELTTAMTKVVPDILDSIAQVGKLSSKDVPSLSLSSLKKGAVKFPKPPTLTLPKLKGIDDTMPNISKDLTAGLEQVLATVLIDISAMILETVFNSVFSSASKLGQAGVDAFPSEFGGQDINELLEDFNPSNQSAVENAMKKLGIGPSTEQYDIDINEIANEMKADNSGGDTTIEKTPKTSKQVISEISSVLTPIEVVDLLEGTPSTETLQVVEVMMGEGNQSLLDSINKKTSVKELFKGLGKLADPNKLQAIRNTVEQILPNPSGLLCEYENFSTIGEKDSPGDVIRRRALEGKLDKECVETQMSLIRERKKERLANMLSLANGKDILAGQIPPVLGSCGKGIINKNHQTVEHMNEKLINAIFDPIKMSFSTEANTIGNSLIEGEMKQPSEYDDQYEALKAQLATAGITGIETSEDVDNDKINQGFQGILNPSDDPSVPSADQQKFDSVASAFYVFDGELAPTVREIYAEKVAQLDEDPMGAVDKQFNMPVKYIDFGTPPEVKALQSAKNKVDSLINQIKNLDKKNTDGSLDQEIDDLKQMLGPKKASVGTKSAFGQLNTKLEELKNASAANDGKVLLKNPTVAYLNYFTKDREAEPTEIVDTWRLSIPNTLSRDIFTNRFGTQGSTANHMIAGYSHINEIIPQSANEYVFKANFNERDQVFANMILNKWNQICPGINFDATEDGETINDFYREKRAKIFNYFLNIFASKIPTSNLFDNNTFSELDLGSGKYDANFDASGKCSPDKTDNLLGIEDLKKQAREEYNNACDEEENSKKPSGIEKANLRSLMRAAIRLSIMDAVSKSIFMGSIYSMEDMLLDPALIAFFEEMIKSDLIFLENEYYEEFLIQAKAITDERKKRGEKLLNPFTKQEDSRLVHIDDPRTQNGENSLLFIIREELKYLSKRIDERLRPEIKNMDMYFINKMVPTMDVRRHHKENVFHKIIKDSDVADIPIDAILKKEFAFLSKSNKLFDKSGGFVLEKYVRVVDADSLTESGTEGLTQAEIDFITAWQSRTGGISNENPVEIPSKIVDVGQSKENSFAYTSGAVNIEAFAEALQEAVNASQIEEIEISKFLKKFDFGVRLVYIPPTAEKYSFLGTEQIYEGKSLGGFTPLYAEEYSLENSDYQDQLGEAFEQFEDSKPPFFSGLNPLIDKDVTFGSATIEAGLELAAKKEKLFRIEETFSTMIKKATEIEDNEPVEYNFQQMVNVKVAYPIEIARIEKGYGFIDAHKESNGKVNLQNFIISLKDGQATNFIIAALKKDLINTKRYKFAFHYNIPYRRALSLLFVHQNLTTLKNYPDISRTFSISKDMVRSSFFNMIPGSMWWSKQDKRIEEQGGNSGMMETANNTMTMDGPSGSDIAMKIAVQAAIIITKALAAQQDPNYALMKKLDTFGLTFDGMTWKSVPALYPVNFPLPFPPFMGWGPPMTPLGMVAYSLPFLPGEKKKSKNKEKEDSEC